MSAPYDRPEKSSYSNEPGPNKKPCRACTDFQSWMNMYGKSEKKQGNQSSSTSTAAGKTDGAEAGSQIGKDCPLDKDELGTNTWSFLHTMAAYYPERPSQQQQKDMKDMMYLFGKFYPCDFCAEDFRKDIKKNEPDTKDQHSFSQWMCNRHNEVNRKLGKPEFDCRLVNERWRDGWKDGSCD